MITEFTISVCIRHIKILKVIIRPNILNSLLYGPHVKNYRKENVLYKLYTLFFTINNPPILIAAIHKIISHVFDMPGLHGCRLTSNIIYYISNFSDVRVFKIKITARKTYKENFLKL